MANNQHTPSCSRFPNQTSATTYLRSTAKYLFIIPLKKCTLREQISILLSYPNKLLPEHIEWKLVPDFSSKHCKSTISNFTHDPYRTLIPHRGVHFTLKRSLSALVYIVCEKVQGYFL